MIVNFELLTIKKLNPCQLLRDEGGKDSFEVQNLKIFVSDESDVILVHY